MLYAAARPVSVSGTNDRDNGVDEVGVAGGIFTGPGGAKKFVCIRQPAYWSGMTTKATRLLSTTPGSNHPHLPRTRPGFTLIELLIVIAIIGVLAALTLGVLGPMKVKQQISVAQAELSQMQAAIERYKSTTGVYPPDNPGNPVINQLYYELAGTTYDPVNKIFKTLDGSASINVADVSPTFGVAGFANCAMKDGDPPARSYLSDLRPGQIGTCTLNGVTVKLLVGSVGWPANVPFPPVPAQPGINPWRYISSKPVNNIGSYDLWMDLAIRGKTYRISNWSRNAQIF
jgi:prepilin-type N-terminal cleavage/methylation domain-containing protein